MTPRGWDIDGDLRPQYNPQAPVLRQFSAEERTAVEPVLLARFLELRRPIADSSTQTGPPRRLSDIGRFFYLVEALQRLGSNRIDHTLLCLLDEFSILDLSSYDELYLWSIVHLSRQSLAHVRTFWPMAIDLDCRYRFPPWKRAGSCVDEPYRFTELVFFYYVLHAPRGGPALRPATAAHGSLGRCLTAIAHQLSDAGSWLVADVLSELYRQTGKPGYRDALGMLRGGRKARRETEPPALGF
ncbi:MAG: hypothetical protein NZ700_11995 [Gemmataceae bacterium]|nr:hypothetical protein [Gemmataceae bacterium]MDW8266624.1 hypothetical protein [Gemmataceae bacterium]